MDLAGWPHDSFSQIDLGHKLALQNPFESVLIETGAVLQECEPEEILGLRSTKGILKVKEMKHILTVCRWLNTYSMKQKFRECHHETTILSMNH
jgi:hypothetical protein